jgi:arginyl-tRNA synthetase
MLNFEGNSGPYLQYTYARLKSILRKTNFKKYDPKYLNEKIEIDLILKLEEFPSVIERITINYSPNYLTDYLFELAKLANSFYQSLPVLKAEKGIKEARLALIKTVAKTLKTGLNLLGIEAPEKM